MRNEIDFAMYMEAVALDLRGQPSSKHGNEWRYGTNGSLSIDIKRGTFFNHETNEGGGLLEFIRSEKPGTDAIDYLSAHGHIRPNGNGAAAPDIAYDAASDPFKGVKFKKTNKQFHIVKTWAYADETGAELFEVCRLENGETGDDGKPRKTYRQRHQGHNGEYIDNVKGIRQVPYRLPELIKAILQGKTVFITEGEKCADAVIALGGAATCNAMGAGKFPDALVPFFGGADICILPDNDEPGAQHAALVASKLHGTAKQVRILELPDLPPKGDVADWIAAWGSLAQLYKLAEATPIHAPTSGSAKTSVLPSAIMHSKTLKTKEFQPIKYIVRGYVVEGATILAGRPKVGKSWLALDWGLAVARSGFVFGDVHCKEGEVLYIALEDNERRLQSRIGKLLGYESEWPEKFNYATEWPRANEGGLDAIKAWITSKETPRLVVIDVLEAFRTRARGKDNVYAADYETIKALQVIASELHVAILIVHHLRKAASDGDAQDKISGTLGLTGAADTFLVLDSGPNGVTLEGRGRDIMEINRSVLFNRDTCRWEILGEAADVRRSSERNKILDALRDATEAMTPTMIAAETGMKNANVRFLLGKLVSDREVLKGKRSQYAHNDHPNFLK